MRCANGRGAGTATGGGRGADVSRAEQLLSFRLEGSHLALPCRRVVRVALIRRIVPVPSDLPHNLGIVVHRGVAVGLLDLARLLDGVRGPAGAPAFPRRPELPARVVFARFARGVAGFPVDELLGVESNAGPGEATSAEVLDLDALESPG